MILKKNLSQNHILLLLALVLVLRFVFVRNLLLFHFTTLLLLILLFRLFMNWKRSLMYGLLLFVLILFAQRMMIRRIEGFTANGEDEDGGKEVEKKDGNDGKEAMRRELDALIKKFEAQHASGKHDINTSKLEKYTDRLKGKIPLSEDDVVDNEPMGIDTFAMKHDEVKPDPLKKAQKETYELIDTINILKETVQTLNPVLSEGKKVMDLFKGLNMDGMEGDKMGGAGALSALLGEKK